MKLRTPILALAMAAAGAADAQTTLSFQTASRGPLLGDHHYGVFFEEINHAGDGGLYAELIRNASMEDNASNPDNWWPVGGATFSTSSSNLLNPYQGLCMKLNLKGAGDGVRNEGWWGINIVQGQKYKASFWVRSDNYTGSLRLELQNAAGDDLGAATVDVGDAKEWKKLTAEITATGNDGFGWFAIRGTAAGTVYLDVVSLMPPTFKNRENGCRKDLAEMVEAMRPRFVRFPGGCYVEGGNRYQWKNTIGPVENRIGLHNSHWGYPVGNGMGFKEYLEFCEDLGAAPLFVVNVGIYHGWFVEYTQIDDYIQEALDAIEYANGDETTYWGRRRIADGHPEPFGLRFMEIGNENYNFHPEGTGDQSDHYAERYWQFHQAIKARHPEMVLIGNVESWGTDFPTWRNPYPVDLVDEHYYRSPDWFAAKYNMYDNYSRTGHGVYAGEYAVTSDYGTNGTLKAALGEAIYMAGMERNSDVCQMASYAPMFWNEGNGATQWRPDMIHFNAHSSFGSPSYWVQQMMGANMGYQNIHWTEANNSQSFAGGQLALSSWNTKVVYRDVKVTGAAGSAVYSTDFQDADDYASHWAANGGTWAAGADGLAQTDETMQGKLNVLDIPTGDCTIELTAVKTSGAEGFLVAFGYTDASNYIWWNIGGWNNGRHGVEQCIDGTKTTLASTAGCVEENRAYNIKIVKAGDTAQCYLDGELVHTVSMAGRQRLYTCASINEEGTEAILKIINYNGEDVPATLTFDATVAGDATATVLTHADNYAENTMENPDNVAPATGTIAAPATGDGHSLSYTVPGYSLCIVRVPLANLPAPGGVAAEAPEAKYTFDFNSRRAEEKSDASLAGGYEGGARPLALADGNVALYTGPAAESGYVDLGTACGDAVAAVAGTRNYSLSIDIMPAAPANFASYSWALALSTGEADYTGIVCPSNNNNWYAETAAGGSKASVNSNSRLQQGRWHNVTYTQADGTARIYVDGQLRGTSAGMNAFAPAESAKAWLGRSPYAADAVMAETWMDNLRVFDRALSADEVAAIWSKTREMSAASDEVRLYALRDTLEALTALAGGDFADEVAAANTALAEYGSLKEDPATVIAHLLAAREALAAKVYAQRATAVSGGQSGVVVDITALLANPDFADGSSGWSGTPMTAAPGTVAEQYWKLFDNYQVLANMPAGTYRMTIQGFQRSGTKNTGYNAHRLGTEELPAVYYLRSGDAEASHPFMSLYDEHTDYTYYNYPDNVAQAEKAFNTKDFYRNEAVTLELARPGDLRVGLLKYAGNMPQGWVCFDNVKLYYVDQPMSTGVADIVARAARQDCGVYDLSGRRVGESLSSASLAPGVYVVAGRKVLVK